MAKRLQDIIIGIIPRLGVLPNVTVRYFQTYVGFFGFKILNFTIFGGVFRKMNTFRGIKILWIFLGGHHKIRLYLGVISIHFRVLF